MCKSKHVTKATEALTPSYIQLLFAIMCGFGEPEDAGNSVRKRQNCSLYI
jgi:hypothetical protein